MPVIEMVSRSYTQIVYDQLRAGLENGTWTVGQSLPPIKQLAAKMGTSIRPVQKAFELLERDGYVRRQRGVGTEVIDTRQPASLANSVAVCMESGMHIYGELALMLAGSLHEAGKLPTIVNSVHPESAASMLLKLARAGARHLVLHKTSYFGVAFLRESAFAGVRVVGAVHWTGERLPGLRTVLSDPVVGASLVADRLWNRGHRHVLVLTTEAQHLLDTRPLQSEASLRYSPMRQGVEFVRAWEARGGRCSSLLSAITDAGEVSIPAAPLIEMLDMADAPTAVFGLRDLEVLRCQQTLLQHRPAALVGLDLVGYYNTPWSNAGFPAITTVDIRLEAIAERLVAVCGEAPDNRDAPIAPILIPPRLIVRD